MLKKVNQANKVIDVFLYSFILINVLVIITYFTRFGIKQGIYRFILLAVSTMVFAGLISSIKDGNMAARMYCGAVSVVNVIYTFYITYLSKNSLNIGYKIVFTIYIAYFLFFGIFILFSPQVNAIKKYKSAVRNIKWYWNWEGKPVGYIGNGYLWNANGEFLGKIVENEIYNDQGNYIGEIYPSNKRICINNSKSNKRIEEFQKPCSNQSFEITNNTSNMKIYGQFIDFKI